MRPVKSSCAPADHTSPPPVGGGRGAFTLLELLVVVAILATVSVIAMSTFRGASEQANDRIVRAEMQEIAKAVRQFKADTGYYPKTGPFALDDGAGVPYDSLDRYLGTSANAAVRARWFYSPANFYQLLSGISPLDSNRNGKRDSGEHPLTYWNPETGRGWRGPYLHGYRDGFVTIGDAINDDPDTHAGNDDLAHTSARHADAASGLLSLNVPAIADPFEHGPKGDFLVWRSRSTAEDSDPGTNPPLEKWGRPYLLIDIHDEGADDMVRMGIVSMGADGFIGPDTDGEIDDIILPVE